MTGSAGETGAGHQPIRLMSAEDRRAYNRLVKQRSRAIAIAKARNGALPTTKEAGIALVAVAAARTVRQDDGMAERLAHEVAALVGAPCDGPFRDQFAILLRRLAAPRREQRRPERRPDSDGSRPGD